MSQKDGFNANVRDVTWLNEEQLRRLAEDKKNRVFAQTYETPERVWTADEKRDLVRDIREKYLQLRQQYPDWEDDKIRTHICSDKYRWRQFAKTFSNTFSYITTHTTEEEGVKHQYYMLYLSKQVETGQITPEQMKAMMCEYGHKVTTTPHPLKKKK
jgi:negative regulator of genetic competence, sporulation and motility